MACKVSSQRTITCLSCLRLSNRPAYPTQRRTLFGDFFGLRAKDKPKKGAAKSENPFIADLLTRKVKDTRPSDAEARGAHGLVKGDVGQDSLFSEDDQSSTKSTAVANTKQTGPRYIPPERLAIVNGERRDIDEMAMILDPDPRNRELWQRRRVMQLVRRRERLTPEQYQKKTEREITMRSHNFRTSVKKLGPLARQIAGKSVDDAIVQMRFSKKKAAREVLQHLEYVRDTAVVSRGMGLGAVKVEGDDGSPASKSIDIQRLDGKRQTVTDQSKIYVDQAWVGRGPFGRKPDYRAFGRMYIMRPPTTHLSIKLKEEATLVREWKEREEKRDRHRLANGWVQLPDRPIQGQNQYYTW